MSSTYTPIPLINPFIFSHLSPFKRASVGLATLQAWSLGLLSVSWAMMNPGKIHSTWPTSQNPVRRRSFVKHTLRPRHDFHPPTCLLKPSNEYVYRWYSCTEASGSLEVGQELGQKCSNYSSEITKRWTLVIFIMSNPRFFIVSQFRSLLSFIHLASQTDSHFLRIFSPSSFGHFRTCGLGLWGTRLNWEERGKKILS